MAMGEVATQNPTSVHTTFLYATGMGIVWPQAAHMVALGGLAWITSHLDTAAAQPTMASVQEVFPCVTMTEIVWWVPVQVAAPGA